MTRRGVWRRLLFSIGVPLQTPLVSLYQIPKSRLLKYLKADAPHSLVGTYKQPPLWFSLTTRSNFFFPLSSPLCSTFVSAGAAFDTLIAIASVGRSSLILGHFHLHPLVSMISPTFLALHTILHIVRHDQLGRLCVKLCRLGNSKFELTKHGGNLEILIAIFFKIWHSWFFFTYFLRLQCSASVGMKAFFDMMDKDPRKVMILGGSCNSVTDSIAKTSKHWRIPVVSGEFIHFFRDTHPLLLADELFGCVANQSTSQGRCAGLIFFFLLSTIESVVMAIHFSYILFPFIPFAYYIFCVWLR